MSIYGDLMKLNKTPKPSAEPITSSETTQFPTIKPSREKTKVENSITPLHHHTSVTAHRHTVTPSHQSTITPVRERVKKKHGFVVYKDQLDALREIQISMWRRDGVEPEVGELVREALDEYIPKKKRKLE